MTFVVRGNSEALRSSMAFTVSTCLHVAVLVWLVLGSVFAPIEKPQSVYAQLIRPHENQLIWYRLSDRLPEVRPSQLAALDRPRLLRARRKFNQEIVVGPKELPRPPQLIRAPAPEIVLPKSLPLPNAVVAPPPRRLRAFTPPPPRERPAPKPAVLPQAPKLSQPAAPAAPPIDLSSARPPRPKPLPFTLPEAAKKDPVLPVLPSAPELENRPADLAMPRIPKGFTAPAGKRAAPTPEPAISTDSAAVVVPTVRPPSDSPMVVVGLNPVYAPNIAPPPVSHEAGFSAGPKPREEGADSTANDALLTVPGLTVHGGLRESQPSLLAAIAPLTRERMAAMAASTPPPPPPDPPIAGARRVAVPPDPRFAGRAVYTVAVQMPNITSYSGSWQVWFAERKPLPAALPAGVSAPVPIRKVDPKYIRSAVDEKVEGVVRLFAVIRKTGQADSIEVLRSLDPRLDQSAQEALLKWQFEPARRDGTPVDVDAVFEIPFRLAPRTSK